MRNDRGFTLVELLVATAVAVIVSGTVYVLIDAGIDMHERGTELGMASVGLAGATAVLRADVARAQDVRVVAADSLVLDRANGDRIAWASRVTTTGLALFRSVDEGSGFSERPKRAVAELIDGATDPARTVFTELVDGRIRAHLIADDRHLSIEAAPWSRP